MMNDKRYYTDFWVCSCNKKNHLFNRKCTKCNEDIPTELLGAIYFDEINQQNITYEEEEKKIKIVLGAIGIVVLPFVLGHLSLILYLIGLLVLFIILLWGMTAGGICVSYNIWSSVKI